MITDIHLQHFRSYGDESFELSPSVNIIVGSNASGKTNLLEAVLVIARGSSYRAKDAELVEFNKPWARLVSHTSDGDERAVKLLLKDNGAQKEIVINGQTYKRLSLQKSLPAVVFEPNNLQMLSGAPELRRQFLDDLLEQTEPGFAATRRHFKRVLAQRNALLKKGYKLAKDQLFVWDIRLSELGAHIVNARQALVLKMNKQVQGLHNELTNSKTKIQFSYNSQFVADNYATDLLHKLEARSQIDCERGFTSYGPHRDDFQVFINSHLVQESASRGEMRTILLICKILEAKLLEQARDLKPILLLDDVFSELDGARRQALTQFLQPYQTFITTTDADVVVQHFTQTSNVIPLNKN